MARLTDLATKDPAALRLILACYAQQHPEVRTRVYQQLRDRAWYPTPGDCPGEWARLEQWYRGLERTGQLVME